MVYDPRQISYDQLLEAFWQLHDPTSALSLRQYRNAIFSLRQYRNAIFYLSDEQRRMAEGSRRKLETRLGQPVRTAIEAAGTFTPAENYHQKHFLQGNKPLMDVLRKRYPDPRQLFRSTEAARLNGFLGCNGDPQTLTTEIHRLGLPALREQDLLDSLDLTCRNFHDKGCALPSRHRGTQPR